MDTFSTACLPALQSVGPTLRRHELTGPHQRRKESEEERDDELEEEPIRYQIIIRKAQRGWRAMPNASSGTQSQHAWRGRERESFSFSFSEDVGWALTTWTSPLVGLSACVFGNSLGPLPGNDGPGVGDALCGFFAGAPSK